METTQIQDIPISVELAEGPNDEGKTVARKFGFIPPHGRVNLVGWTCTGASGTYGTPTTVVVRLMLVNTKTNQAVSGTVTKSGGGTWSGTFPKPPPGNYKVLAVGNTGDQGWSPAFDC
jgi:hypothetical protein